MSALKKTRHVGRDQPATCTFVNIYVSNTWICVCVCVCVCVCSQASASAFMLTCFRGTFAVLCGYIKCFADELAGQKTKRSIFLVC